tara:strand:+ start:367 stop:483 length:117 start_codon:yes stop_codon:yes gene_type:complete
VTSKFDSVTFAKDFYDHAADGGTRVVGIYKEEQKIKKD